MLTTVWIAIGESTCTVTAAVNHCTTVKIALICMHCTVPSCTGCTMYCGNSSMSRDLSPRLFNQNTVLTAAATVTSSYSHNYRRTSSTQLSSSTLAQRTDLPGCRSLWYLHLASLNLGHDSVAHFLCRRFYCLLLTVLHFIPPIIAARPPNLVPLISLLST